MGKINLSLYLVVKAVMLGMTSTQNKGGSLGKFLHNGQFSNIAPSNLTVLTFASGVGVCVGVCPTDILFLLSSYNPLQDLYSPMSSLR